MSHRFKAFLHRIMPMLCTDCRIKMKKRYGIGGKVRHHTRRAHSRAKSGFKHIRIKMRGGKSRMQKVKVLASGKYRFVKN